MDIKKHASLWIGPEAFGELMSLLLGCKVEVIGSLGDGAGPVGDQFAFGFRIVGECLEPVKELCVAQHVAVRLINGVLEVQGIDGRRYRKIVAVEEPHE